MAAGQGPPVDGERALQRDLGCVFGLELGTCGRAHGAQHVRLVENPLDLGGQILASPGRKCTPVMPSLTTSAIGPIAEATIGVPRAKHSMITRGKPSYQVEVKTKKLAAPSSS